MTLLQQLQHVLRGRYRWLFCSLRVDRCIGLAILLCTTTGAAFAQSAQLPESSVKAAFLYKFLSFIEWPRALHADEPFKFGVVGSETIATELRALVADRTLEGHPVQVANVQHAADLDGVQLLFVGRPAMQRLPALLQQAQKQNAVVVTEADAATRGSVINFVIVDGHVRFEVSLPAAKRTGIKLSSRLLAVAKAVETETP